MELSRTELQAIVESARRPLVYTTEELAVELHTYPHKIQDLKDAGAIRGIRKGRDYIYPAAEVDRFLDQYLDADIGNKNKIAAEVKKRNG